MTTVAQAFFIFLLGDDMIPCCYDITVGGYALDFLNLGIFTQFFALKCCVKLLHLVNVIPKVISNVLKSSLQLIDKLI